jgi:hypothetical protein
MADNTNRPGTDPEPNDKNGKLNPFQQHFGITLDDVREERRCEALIWPKGKRKA